MDSLGKHTPPVAMVPAGMRVRDQARDKVGTETVHLTSSRDSLVQES